MEKERRIKTLSLVALIVAVLGLTVAFAALSQTLTINGTATVNAAEWDIHLENLSEPEITGDAKVIKAPTLNKTSVSDYEILLTKPGDSVTWEVDLVNAGTIDAVIDKITSGGLNMLDDSDFTYDAAVKYYKSIISSFDVDGDGVTSDEEYLMAFGYYDGTVKLEQNLMLEFSILSADDSDNFVVSKGERRKVTFGLTWRDDSEVLPKGDVSINLNLDLGLSQK